MGLRIYTTGELRPGRAAMLAAPSIGGILQIVHLAKSSTHVNPGGAVVEFDPAEQEYDVEQMEIQSKVTETVRGNLEPGQHIEARVDGLPLRRFAGRIKSLADMAASSSIFSETSAVRSFEASFEFDSYGAALSLGCTAQVRSTVAP